jgi:hypothetical protein
VTDVNEVQLCTDAIMTMLKEDQASGQIPAEVSSLNELDNYVDVDDYYRRLPADWRRSDCSGVSLKCSPATAVSWPVATRLAYDQWS